MRKKLLIADDNRAITEVLKLNFDLLGYEVQVASDGEEAEVRCRTFRPDVLILDVMMPKKNGYKVCRDLKNSPETAGIPIILLTAKNLKEDVYWGYDSGADAYITKPYDPRQLEILVDQLIQEKETGQRTTAWTGLPTSARVEQEHRARLDAGAPSVLLEVSLDEAAAEAYGARYGKPKLKDLVHRLAWQLYDAAREFSAAGVVGQSPDERFLLAVHSEEAPAVRAGIDVKLNEVIRASYEESDLKRGAVFVRNSQSGEERRCPLLTLVWREL